MEEVFVCKDDRRLRYNAKSKADFPTVGDWVLVKDFSVGEFGRIERVLNRKSILQRKSVGRASETAHCCKYRSSIYYSRS